ncbi:hypothetical protein B0H14DRAFT_3165339 [Mycena olivaceomarginata]|nr:hypothetical protein B0H14DRAFT_3165339 [Mycena olivaceomarginata]
MPASATYLPSLLLDSTPPPPFQARLHTRPPNNGRKIPSCSKLPIALYPGCSTLNAGGSSSVPLQRVYDKPAWVSARKAGQFPRHSAISLSPLFRVWEPNPERGECRDYEPEADWRASAFDFWEGEERGVFFLLLMVCTVRGRRCPFGDSFCASFLCGVPGAEELRAGEREERRRRERGRSLAWQGVVVPTSFVFFLGNLVRGERASAEFGGGGGGRCPAESGRGGGLTTSCLRAGRATVTTMREGGEWGVENLEYDSELGGLCLRRGSTGV